MPVLWQWTTDALSRAVVTRCKDEAAQGASRRLQRVFEPSDLVTAERVVEPFQHSDQAIGQAAGMRPFKSVEHRVVSRRAVLHLRK